MNQNHKTSIKHLSHRYQAITAPDGMADRICLQIEETQRRYIPSSWKLTLAICSVLLVVMVPFVLNVRAPESSQYAYYPDMSAISELSVRPLPTVNLSMPGLSGLDMPASPAMDVQIHQPSQRQESVVLNKLLALNLSIDKPKGVTS